MQPRYTRALLSFSFLFSASPSIADSADATKAVIVVFKPGTSFDEFRGDARPDDRALAEPDAWNYLDRGVTGATQRLEGKHRFKAKHVYSHVVKGFAGNLTKKQVDDLKEDPVVAYIEDDGPVKGDAQILPWGVDRVEADLSSTRAGDGTGSVPLVTVYVIDSGIGDKGELNKVGHVNFAGGKNIDCEGHGTHVAGTIGAKDSSAGVVGVAPGVRVFGVKVLNCEASGERSNVIKGVDWVTANAVLPAVANMSLGGDPGVTLDDAVQRSADAGVFYALSAGNDSRSACRQSPARAGRDIDGEPNGVIATASTTISDAESSFSNYGPCVDIWAPGSNILSTKLGSGNTTMSGTSMASPHVAGAAALYLSAHPLATAREVEAALRERVIFPGKKSRDGRLIELLQVDQF
jgi:aqualysin 1